MQVCKGTLKFVMKRTGQIDPRSLQSCQRSEFGTLLADLLLLARFWRSRERLCMNRVRSLLNMRCMLPGYSLVPKPNMPDLTAILVFHGTAGSIITIGFVTKRTLALEKPV